jgi:hypothetical protein
MYPDFNGRFRHKHLGTVKIGTMGPDDLKTLLILRFMIGDFMTLTILPPRDDQREQ